MSYPMSHKIDMRHKYTSADDTDIRKTFQRVRENAEAKNQPVVDADLIPAGTAAWNDTGISTAECH